MLLSMLGNTGGQLFVNSGKMEKEAGDVRRSN